uniref:Mur ligase central domain-containing protein n=1 Tax=Glossina morsitans morsitans TaxID=37546 RepID=A0A1B0FDE9_GLOMM
MESSDTAMGGICPPAGTTSDFPPESSGSAGCIKRGISGAQKQSAECGKHASAARDAADSGITACEKLRVFSIRDNIHSTGDQNSCPKEICEEVEAPSDVTVIKVTDTRYAMAFISAAYFGHPAKELKTIGITGTKGKTTTTYMVKSILENAGYKVGLIGTIEAIIGEEHIPAHNTTPESYLVQEYFRKMADAGCDCVVMEVSSQGLMLHRTQGFVFDYGIFTNIEPDHIGPNEHKDFDDYLRCKSMLLRQCKVGIVNRDDEHFERIIEGHTCTLETYGFSPEADLRAEDAHMVGGRGYLGISYQLKGLMEFPVEIDIPGKHH